MKKLLIIIALALLLPAAGLCWKVTDALTAVVAVKNDGGGVCSVDNDQALSTTNWDARAADLTQTWVCSKHSVTSGDPITGVGVLIYDGGSGAGNVLFGLYGHDAANDEPDVDGNVIATKSFASSYVQAANYDAGMQYAVFDSLVEGNTNTTVWVCSQEQASAMKRNLDSSSSGDRYCVSTTESPVNGADWTCVSDDSVASEVVGCPQ